MTHFIYILYSQPSDKFYIGETTNLLERLKIHNSIELNTNSTKSGIPWEVYHSMEVFDRKIARKIEMYIKKHEK